MGYGAISRRTARPVNHGFLARLPLPVQSQALQVPGISAQSLLSASGQGQLQPLQQVRPLSAREQGKRDAIRHKKPSSLLVNSPAGAQSSLLSSAVYVR